MENGMLNELNLSAGLHFGLPSSDFWQNGIVWLVRPSRAGQVFHIGLNGRECQSGICKTHSN